MVGRVRRNQRLRVDFMLLLWSPRKPACFYEGFVGRIFLHSGTILFYCLSSSTDLEIQKRALGQLRLLMNSFIVGTFAE